MERPRRTAMAADRANPQPRKTRPLGTGTGAVSSSSSSHHGSVAAASEPEASRSESNPPMRQQQQQQHPMSIPCSRRKTGFEVDAPPRHNRPAPSAARTGEAGTGTAPSQSSRQKAERNSSSSSSSNDPADLSNSRDRPPVPHGGSYGRAEGVGRDRGAPRKQRLRGQRGHPGRAARRPHEGRGRPSESFDARDGVLSGRGGRQRQQRRWPESDTKSRTRPRRTRRTSWFFGGRQLLPAQVGNNEANRAHCCFRRHPEIRSAAEAEERLGVVPDKSRTLHELVHEPALFPAAPTATTIGRPWRRRSSATIKESTTGGATTNPTMRWSKASGPMSCPCRRWSPCNPSDDSSPLPSPHSNVTPPFETVPPNPAGD
jgi:hypothetical protein